MPDTKKTACPKAADNIWRLVVSDLDGTLLNDQNRISPENLAAVADLKRQGIGFTLATGRIDAMTRVYVRQLGVILPIIACNGAIIRDCQTERILFQQNLPTAETLAMIDWLNGHRFDYLCYTADHVYYPEHSRRIGNFFRYNQFAADSGVMGVPLFPLAGRSSELAIQGLVKIVAVLSDSEAHQSVCRLLNDFPACEGVLSMEDTVDIMAAGVTKGQGLQKLAEFLKIRVSEIAAIGDNDNDASMLGLAGLGIAMSNATASALAASRQMTTGNNQSGVALAIRQQILSGCQ